MDHGSSACAEGADWFVAEPKRERMACVSKIIPLFYAGVVSAFWALAYGGVAQDWTPSNAYLNLRDRISAVGTVSGLAAKEKQVHLKDLEALGKEVEQDWRQKDAEGYGRLTLHLCEALGSLDLATPQRHFLARTYALRALERADDMPLDVECGLVRYVQNETDDQGKPLAAEAKAQLRKQQVSAWLHALRRIDQTIDPHFNSDDPNVAGVGNVMPPPATGLPAGVDPAAIKDAKLRGEYEAAIEANGRKIARATLQIRARDLKTDWGREAERFIVSTYIEIPDGAAELDALLKQYIEDAATRTRILDAVKAKSLPDNLQIRNTTRPSK
jgi:hypothetical protein